MTPLPQEPLTNVSSLPMMECSYSQSSVHVTTPATVSCEQRPCHVQCKQYCILFSVMIRLLTGHLMWSCVLAMHCTLNSPLYPPMHASLGGDVRKWIDYCGCSQNSKEDSRAWFGGNLNGHKEIVGVISSHHSLIFPLCSSPPNQCILNSTAQVEMTPACHQGRDSLERSRLWIRQSGLLLMQKSLWKKGTMLPKITRCLIPFVNFYGLLFLIIKVILFLIYFYCTQYK